MLKKLAIRLDSANLPPGIPVMNYDGDCRFCLLWIHYWKHLSGERVRYQSKTGLAAVELELPNGEIYRGAEAVFASLAYSGKRLRFWFYKNLPGFAAVSELGYRIIAANRGFFYSVTRLLWGKDIRPANYFLVRAVFLKILALIYLIATLSFGVQAIGLIGSNGILPVTDFLAAAKTQLHNHAYWEMPTVFWINSGDTAIHIVALLGIIFSILMFFGILPRVSLIALFVIYLSFVSAGQVFMQFQWDALLLEAGFLAILIGFTMAAVPLFRWLIFRLMFLSGAVKLLSGDPNWRHLTALDYHFETQPLPTPLAWFLHNLPARFHKFSALGMFFVELVLPFFIFLPRRARLLAAAGIAGLETLIFLSGNYTFFNLLTIALCLFLLDDELIGHLLPKKLLNFIKDLPNRKMPVLGRSLIALIILLMLVVSFVQLGGVFFHAWPKANNFIADLIQPLHVVNTYGLFAVMTTERNEIIIQGSNDGRAWSNYVFKYKPYDPAAAPKWVQPFQPRLDWQMWFAALDNFQRNPWFTQLMRRILMGSQPVLNLLAENPFPDSPPKYARAILMNYQFTTPAEKKSTGNWWKIKPVGLYFPVVALAPGK